ncbi:MAG: HsdR family type I site-specific deoxyribonuclease [Bacteroidetes bacterium]|nr:HsdR family type I site-specific deoxyribonuclease [Bacteroidota bacterium]
MNHNEQQLENHFIDELVKSGWKFIPCEQLDKTGIEDQLLEIELAEKIKTLNKNKNITNEDVKRVINELKFATTNIEGAKKILYFYKQGIPIKYEKDGVVKFTRLFDYDYISNNNFTMSRQVIHTGAEKIKNDIILYINGIPLINIELKDPFNPAESWRNAYNQIVDYFGKIPELYKYIQIGVAANSRARYFPIAQWTNDVKTYEWKEEGKDSVDSVIQMLRPEILLDIIKNFLFVRVEKGEVTKVITRYMQLKAVNKIYNRVKDYYIGKDTKDKGLIWHWQGSGKTFEIITAANKLQTFSPLENPTQFIILDRDDLQTQLSNEYHSLDIPLPKVIQSIEDLKRVITADSLKGMRGVYIVLMHKFRPGEFEGVSDLLNSTHKETIATRKNVICFIDEGHRTQYGLLAGQMKSILKNAFFFAFTGTPVASIGKNTYSEFCYPPEESYLDRYFIGESINDGFTKKITYRQRLDELHLDKNNLETFLEGEYDEIPDIYKEDLKQDIRQKLTTVNVFLEDVNRINKISEDIAKHFLENVDGNFKGMVVTASRLACVRYKHELDKFLPASYSEVVMTYDPNKDVDIKEIYSYMKEVKKRFRNTEIEQITKKIIDDYKEENEPKILIVTDMLLTGFDAPVLQTMYLDKPLKEQRLLQAIARTNRPFKEKETGLILDYIGIFGRIKKAFEVYSKDDLAGAILDMEKMKEDFEKNLKELLNLFSGIDKDYNRSSLERTLEVITAEKKTEEIFSQKYNLLRRLYEFLGSDEIKLRNLKHYQWLTAVYTNYIKRVVKDEKYQEYLKKYFKKTLKLIHNETEVKNLIESKVQIVIDEKFMQEIESDAGDENEKTSNLVFALNKFVLVDKHKNPIYESLIERVEKLVKRWRERIKKKESVSEELKEANSISDEIVGIQKTKSELGLTDAQMAFWLKIKTSLNINVDKELLSSMKDLFTELNNEMIPGWSKNTELRKSIDSKLRQFMFVKVKTKYPMTLEKLNEIHKGISDKMVNYEA